MSTDAPPSPFLLPEHQPLVQRLRLGMVDPVLPDPPDFRGDLRPWQRVGCSVLYLTPRIILADTTGVGKTVQALYYLAMLRARGHLTRRNPAIILCPPQSLDLSWQRDGFDRFLGGMRGSIPGQVMDGRTGPRQRHQGYRFGQSEVFVISYNTFIRDAEYIKSTLHPSVLVCDEAHAFRNHRTNSALAVKQFMEDIPRVALLTATAISTKLDDLHSLLEALGLHWLVGDLDAFKREHENRYVVQRHVMIHGRQRVINQSVLNPVQPYLPAALERLKERVWPYYYRRTWADIARMHPGVDSGPEMETDVVPVPLVGDQLRFYNELRRKELPTGGRGERMRLQARALAMRQCATGLQTVHPRLADVSGKLDVLIDRLKRDWSAPEGFYRVGHSWQPGAPTKVVIFSLWKGTIITLMRRFRAERIGAVVLAGEGDAPHGAAFPYGTKPHERSALRDRFFDDPACQVLIGTTAIEMSLNLQAAPVLVNLNLIANPARMGQIAGRIQRADSPYQRVTVLSFVAPHTVEEGMLQTLTQREGLIADFNNEAPAAMFREFSNDDLRALITHQWDS